jgi:hypothetical protein
MLTADERQRTIRCSSTTCAISWVYVNPPADHAEGLCVDEEAQIRVLERTQLLLPTRVGQVERRA